MVKTEIVIIGAGLTGLTLAYYLKQADIKFTLLEARNRIGGRIHTVHNKNEPPIELGATWIGKQHTENIKLLKNLDIDLFAQLLGEYAIYEPISTSLAQVVQLPPNDDPSFRVKGGTDSLINALVTKININNIETSQIAKSIEQIDNSLIITTNDKQLKANKVVSTLPPHLFVNTIKVVPPLTEEFIDIANSTHTWMGESIKIALTYPVPFWKAKGTSGTIFSNVGPIPEMYDHSNFEKSHFAVKGFLDGCYFSVSKKERLELIIRQLEKYYGNQANDFTNYEETVWKNEPFTSTGYTTQVLPHQNNGHRIYQNGLLHKSLFIAGTETSSSFGGYMEGAIRSAQQVFNQIKNG